MYSDIFGQLSWIDFNNVAQRARVISVLAWLFPALWALTYLFIELPVLMILFGGAVGAAMLFLIVFAAIHMRYARERKMDSPGLFYDLAFWISCVSIFLVGAYGIAGLFA